MNNRTRTAPSSNDTAESAIGKPQLLWWANWLIGNLESATECLTADDGLLERLETMGPGLRRFAKALEEDGIQPEAPLSLAAKAEEWFREQTELRLRQFQALLEQTVASHPSAAQTSVATVRPSKNGAAPTIDVEGKLRGIAMQEKALAAREQSLKDNLAKLQEDEKRFAETKRLVEATDSQLKTREAALRAGEQELAASQKDGDELLNLAIADIEAAVYNLNAQIAEAQKVREENEKVRTRMLSLGFGGVADIPTTKPVPDAEPFALFGDGMTWDEIASWPVDNNSPKQVKELVQRTMTERQRCPRGISHESVGLTWAQLLQEIENAKKYNMRKLKLHLSQRKAKIRRVTRN